MRFPRLNLDLRALATFRILLGLFLFLDTVWARLALGQYDVAWYTSSDNANEETGTTTTPSYLSAFDTPHKSPIHQVWFYRGSSATQFALFGLTAAVSLAFAVGWHCQNGVLKTILFILITAQQNRNMYVHDGSDTFARHLLFWSCFLPLSDVWCLDAYATQRRSGGGKTKTQQTETVTVVSTLAAWAICIQIALMYLGTVFGRTLDSYSWNELMAGKAQWLPPNLTAVHYALSGSFATRDNWINHLIRSSPSLSAGMTATAMLVEGLAALVCLVLPVSSRHWCAVALVGLHFGLLLSLRLPQWQCLAMLTQTIWIPSHVWDSLEGRPSSSSVDMYKKSDGDSITTVSPPSETQQNVPVIRQAINQSNLASRGLQLFWLSYMLYNFCGERQWIPKHDKGDIGESVRLSQYWVMYSKVDTTAHNTVLTGIINDVGEVPRRMDVLEYIRTGGQERPAEAKDFVPHDMSRRFPSARWERALHQWASRGFTSQGKHLCRALCVMINRDRFAASAEGLSAIELRFQHLTILPPGSGRRYAEKRVSPDTVLSVPCEPLPSPWTPSTTGESKHSADKLAEGAA